MEIETKRERVCLIVVCIAVVVHCFVATSADRTDVRVIDLDPVIDIPAVLVMDL